jgi:peptidase E
MIHFFLHGGYAWVSSDQNRKFYRSLLSCVKKEKVKIVILPFARDRSKWEAKIEELSQRFEEASESQKLEIILLSDSMEWRKEEISHADIIFLWWWNTEKLLNTLKTIPELSHLLDEKIVAGSSAWALVFSKCYYENDTNTYHEWLWYLPYGMICHWSNQNSQLEYLKNYRWTRNMLCIKEWEFIEIRV